MILQRKGKGEKKNFFLQECKKQQTFLPEFQTPPPTIMKPIILNFFFVSLGIDIVTGSHGAGQFGNTSRNKKDHYNYMLAL